MREKLKELALLHESANLSDLSSTHIINEGYTHLANLTTAPDKPCFVVMNRKEVMDWFAAIHNAFPDLLAYVRELEAEREERVTMAARAQEALRYVMNGLPATDAVWAAYGNSDSARAWLAARDAQQRREGVIEYLSQKVTEGWSSVDYFTGGWFAKELQRIQKEMGGENASTPPLSICKHTCYGAGKASAERGHLHAENERLRREGAAEAYAEMKRQAEEVGKESGLAARFCKMFAEQCIEEAQRLREGK